MCEAHDAMNYSAQVNNIGKHHKKAGDSGSQGEFLSGFHRDDRLMPVVTITVYWGSKEWDGPRCLYDMISSTDERLKKFVSDYHINLVVPQEITDFDKFRTTLGEVLEAIKVSEDKEAMKQLLATNPQFAEMDNESVAAINTFIGVNIPVNTEGSVTDMCKAWEDQKEEGRTEGRTEGLTEGRTEGHLFEVYSSVQDGDYGIERGAEKLGISEEEFEKRMLEAGFKIPITSN
ncbi:MAG: Rpn family recombination-promoting nuclease/putative transposase [Agathobacter sp.]|nr:Rpn family recombination-promoting nuclease/putative transposase [Agathobacter sp.]